MQHIGLMMVRNEIDIIERYIEHIDSFGIYPVLVLDDSNDGTYERLRDWPRVKYIVKQKTLYGDNACWNMPRGTMVMKDGFICCIPMNFSGMTRS